MADTRLHPVLNYLRQIVGTPTTGGVTDAELLRRFVDGRDEAAFELLLWRHASMVLHVCRQVLRDSQAVEDAFQATFLVFVRKAAAVSRRESLGGWLYRVAYHTALKAKNRGAKRLAAERPLEYVGEPAAPAETDDAEQRDLRRMICEEVDRLPPKYRAPLVACYFEAKTHEEAARHLGWPQGTIASRLARGRDLLNRRLVRRGVTLSAGVFLAALSVQGSQAALTGLVDSTIQSAKLFAAGAAVPPRIADLAEGVLKAMYWTRTKIFVIVLLVAGVSGVGTAYWGTRPRAAEARPEAVAAPKAAAEADKPEDARQIARAMTQSRLNLKKLALALIRYADANQRLFPPPALLGKDGKTTLSWRVLILPYLGENELYEQFKLSEPWDGPNNKKLLSKMPKVYAPPGVKTPEPYSTFYQVFVSPKPKGGGAVGIGGAGDRAEGGAAAEDRIQAAFVEGRQQTFPAHFPDGTSNTILVVEAGKAVPWTKPEDLPYRGDKALPTLGGLFSGIFHAAFADGTVHTLTKEYDEHNLRFAITSNGGEVMDVEQIMDRSPDAVWRRKNLMLRLSLEAARERLRRLMDERDALRGQSGDRKPPLIPASRLEELMEEHARLQKELKEVQEDIEGVDGDIYHRLQNPPKKKDK